jgi:hypothetical protein
MTLEEFHQATFEINYAFYHPGYGSSSMAIPFKGSTVQARLEFNMQDDSQFWYMVTWPTARLVTDKANCTHESMVIPEARAWVKFWPAGSARLGNEAMNFSQTTIGHAWKSYPGGGGPGKYEITIKISFGKITWIPEVSVVLFAKEPVTFRLIKSQDNGRQLAYHTSPETAKRNEECAAFVNRIKDLDNLVSIHEKGFDEQFPPEMKSIASGDSLCGDAAQGKSKNCETYNHWTSLDDVACPSSS